ncbi:uncharacterized protein PFL1_05998 [Pseudozyma flocculosa PF-1]|uniref:Related to 2-hydroxy-6-oxo-6-phenylhexa-2,4-dienoate hydrolase n=2 Tax=Pseudozyma flocculosa TaxID=84751 RepID=A0A5C3F3I4_9BASI|nr:uncharacterized protein PFL1_05998 [Pseudozyma flocculosa PF-1]EPQ26350.1 hypothetical protein PFL1_05998 [Pseudozyma flocculosa PF-1]SPO39063.1 related to 2-hydroxy-6-oxo-6-phenylhexa-2,4-dienoate hydrolase [Pseudozyma flocculosa]
MAPYHLDLAHIFGRGPHGNASTAATAAAAAAVGAIACLFVSSVARGGIDHAIRPALLLSPPRSNDGPYPTDLYPGAKDLETPLGRIRYYDIGPRDGKKLLLVHGISTPTPCWSKLIPKLVEQGYRVLCFDLLGRGYSDAPLVPQDVSLFVSQILFVLGDVPDFDRFDLAGMSLGGAIVSQFAHYFPGRVRRLVLICPAGGTPRKHLGLARRMAFSRLMPVSVVRLLLGAVNILPKPPKGSVVHWQSENHAGYQYSFISSLQCSPVFDSGEVHEKVVQSFGKRCVAIWGDADDIVPLATKRYFGPGLEVKVIPQGNHWIVLTHPDLVAQHMLEFLA